MIEGLRIGNYLVTDDDLICQVSRIETKKFTEWNSGDYHSITALVVGQTDRYVNVYNDNYKPIALTEEILLKCGFKYSEPFPNIRGILTLDIFEVGYDKDDFVKNQFSLRIAKSVIVKVKYLHELQNIYYYMTNGKELEVNL